MVLSPGCRAAPSLGHQCHVSVAPINLENKSQSSDKLHLISGMHIKMEVVKHLPKLSSDLHTRTMVHMHHIPVTMQHQQQKNPYN